MSPDAEPAQPPEQAPVTASVTVAGEEAALLRDLAAVLGRTPEDLAIAHAAGALLIPRTTIGESEFADWALFDGPPDLSAEVSPDPHVR